jgi:magnesium chelatase subunit D
MTSSLSLPALVGLDAARQALLLLAVEPRLGGVVLAAPAGSGKSSLARGFRALLGQAPFVELPPGTDEESLLGGLDIQATVRAGRRIARAGLLARAHGGVLYVDGLNLLPDASANHLLAALESGVVRLEREGMSMIAPACFSLLGSYDPAEGLPRRHLLDRVGLLVVLPAAADAGQRAEVVRRNLSPGQQWDDELALLCGLVRAAREQLPLIAIAEQQIEQLVAAALAFGVEGQRADLFAAYAACASAALALRDAVEQEDIELAVRLVILPRATRMPTPADDRPANDDRTDDNQRQSADNRPTTSDDQPPSTAEPPEPDPQALDEQVLSALAAELPSDLSSLPFRALRRGRSGSRGTTSATRGRHIRSTAGNPRRARIDIPATLRAAAPWQRLRRDERPTTEDERLIVPTPALNTSGDCSSFVLRPSSVILRADDLRVKHFRSKAGALFLFAVDASGSMALHRMGQAKGAVHALLQQAYVHRDRVALLAFRGSDATLLLPPSQSVELARRALDLLPTGGGTPLSSALLHSIEVASQARGRGIFQTVLVLLTDGRGNVGLRPALRSGQAAARPDVEAELQHLARQVAQAGIQAIVVDTQRSYLSRGEARRLADWLEGTYIYLPNANGTQIAAHAQAAIEARREQRYVHPLGGS